MKNFTFVILFLFLFASPLLSQDNYESCCSEVLTQFSEIEEVLCLYSTDSTKSAMNLFLEVNRPDKYPVITYLFEANKSCNKQVFNIAQDKVNEAYQIIAIYLSLKRNGKIQKKEVKNIFKNISTAGLQPNYTEYSLFHNRFNCMEKAFKSIESRINQDTIQAPPVENDSSNIINPIIDSDGDQVLDSIDNCISIANPDQKDTDGDLIGDACDNCDYTKNTDQKDRDKDSLGDLCDNCMTTYNPDQTDNNQNGIGDICENDDSYQGDLFALQINFGLNQYVINPSDKTKLKYIAKYFNNQCKGCYIVLHGFTDDSGDPRSNQILSENRVRAVKLFLINNKVNSSRIETDSFGELGEGKDNSRKVDLQIYSKDKRLLKIVKP